jgi:hypothetical protein
MGCHRSGTNLLYDTLLSAGGFADYRGYLPIYKMLIPRFGNLAQFKNRKRMVAAWIHSKGFRRAGLNASQLTEKVLNECQTGGDFIRIVMNEVSRNQNVARWAVYDPDNLLYIPNIKKDIPEALFVHIIRDGRDVAWSLSKMDGFKPLPWKRTANGLLPAAVYWEWMVRKGCDNGRLFPTDYLEVGYEELVSRPRTALKKLGDFLDHDLDHDRIQQAKLGSLDEPNSSFPKEENCGNPVNRWKSMPRDEVMSLEALVGEYLASLGYGLSTSRNATHRGLRETLIRSFYFGLLNTKLWLKTQTPVGRLASLQALEVSTSVEQLEAE